MRSFELRDEPQLQGASSAVLACNRSRAWRHHQIDDLTSTESGEVTTWPYGIVCLVAQCLPTVSPSYRIVYFCRTCELAALCWPGIPSQASHCSPRMRCSCGEVRRNSKVDRYVQARFQRPRRRLKWGNALECFSTTQCHGGGSFCSPELSGLCRLTLI